MSTTTPTTPTLFETATVDRSERQRTMRHFALSGVLQFFRARHGVSVEAAAVHAGIGHMTLRRVEDGNSVRAATYTKVERLLDLPPGMLQQALGDDNTMVTLAQKVGIDTSDVDQHRRTAAEWVERFGEATVAASSRLSAAQTPPGSRHLRSVETSGAGALGSAHQLPLVRLVGEAVTALASQSNRTPAASGALNALLELMPELARQDVAL